MSPTAQTRSSHHAKEMLLLIPRRTPTVIAFSLALVLLPATLSGCGTERSAKAYCDTMQKHKDRYLSAMADATKQVEKGDAAGVVGGLAGTVSALGDIQRMWEDLAKVAPEEIRPDVESVRDNSAKQLDKAEQSIKDPAGALASALVNALVNSGPIRRVDAYTRQNCTG
jgi:hypothetical protein